MSKRIQIIEDDFDVIETLQFVLKSRGYEIEIAFDGRAGVEMIKNKRPDLLILDLTMPVMDGWAVMVAVKQDPDYQSIPIMILTSSKKAQHIEKARSLGVQSYVLKPFEPQKIVKIVERLLDSESADDQESGLSGVMDGDLLQNNGL